MDFINCSELWLFVHILKHRYTHRREGHYIHIGNTATKKARGIKKLGEFALLLIEYYEPFNSIQPILVQTCSKVLLLFCVKYISCTGTKS